MKYINSFISQNISMNWVLLVSSFYTWKTKARLSSEVKVIQLVSGGAGGWTRAEWRESLHLTLHTTLPLYTRSPMRYPLHYRARPPHCLSNQRPCKSSTCREARYAFSMEFQWCFLSYHNRVGKIPKLRLSCGYHIQAQMAHFPSLQRFKRLSHTYGSVYR